jgi:hypothetical protein
MTAWQLLLAVRRHWAAAVVIVLRRIAYALPALWRFVTLRADEHRTRPWRQVMREVWFALVTATAEQLSAPRAAPT